ncbi:MAG: ribonuclease P protein component [Clostridiales bacterium]|nr:ribonuclease P protein component [Clostridiales bacterium]
MLPAKHRLKKNYQFGYIYKKGKPVPARNLTLIFTAIRGSGLRIGFSVSNKVGKAVVRNLIRRRLRECARALLPRVRPGHHCVVSVRPGITEESFREIARDLEYVFRKAGLLDN